MANESGIAEKELLVTFRRLDEANRTISVVRSAAGRNGQTRQITLILKFAGADVFNRFRDCSHAGAIRVGDQARLVLRQCWDESGSDTSIADFAPLSTIASVA